MAKKLLRANPVLDYLETEANYLENLSPGAGGDTVAMTLHNAAKQSEYTAPGSVLDLRGPVREKPELRLVREHLEAHTFEYRKLVLGKYLLVYGVSEHEIVVPYMKHHAQEKFQ